MKEVISKWMNYKIKNEDRGNEGIKKETVLRMNGSQKHEVNSHDTVLLNAAHHQQCTTLIYTCPTIKIKGDISLYFLL